MSKRRNLLSEDELKIAKISPYVTTDEEAVKLFFEDCKLRNLSPHTLKYYREQFQAIKCTDLDSGWANRLRTFQDALNYLTNKFEEKSYYGNGERYSL